MFVSLQLQELHDYSEFVKALIVPCVCLFYLGSKQKHSKYFTVFLVLFSVSEGLTFIGGFLPINYEYFLGNVLYILAYSMLTVGVIKEFHISHLLQHYKYTIMILGLLNLYILYVMYSASGLKFTTESIVVEFIYNVVILLLLTTTFLNYLVQDNRNTLLLFMGSLSVVFSEVIQYAFYYIAPVAVLNLVSFTLTITGFLFYYVFAVQKDSSKKEWVKVES